MTTRRRKSLLKPNMGIDFCDNSSDKCGTSEDNNKPSIEVNKSTLNVINELNDLIIAKRDLIIESFSSKRGPIGRDQIKDYLNQMIEVVADKRNEILGSNASTTTSNVPKVDSNGINDNSNDHKMQNTLNNSSKVTVVSETESSDKSSPKKTKTKTKTKPKNIQKSIKRRKSVGKSRKGIGKLLFDYRNRNKTPDYQKRLKYVEKDPTIDILNKKIGLITTRLSTIPELIDEL